MKNILSLLCALAGALLLLAAAPARAEQIVSFNFGGCTDALGRPVTSRADPAQKALVEVHFAEGGREIVYNPQSQPQLLPETRAFFYAHACALVRLGQPLDPARSAAQIERADCWAFDTLVRSGLLKADGAQAIESDLSPELWALVPGGARQLDLARCGASAPAKAVRSEGNTLRLDRPNASAAWNACTLACGNRLYACGRSSSCQASFDQCNKGCNGK